MESMTKKAPVKYSHYLPFSFTQVLHPASPSTQVPPLQRSTVREIRAGLVEECYPTDNANRGVCLIFEHDTFRPDMNLSPRKGSEVGW